MELFSILQNKWKKNPFIIIFIYMSLGERIKQARIAKGLKQKEFALLLKIDYTLIIEKTNFGKNNLTTL